MYKIKELLKYKIIEFIKLNKELIHHYNDTIKELKKTTHSIEYKTLYILQYRSKIKELLITNYREFKKMY